MLPNPNWFGEAMLKLANPNLGALDPARALISIRNDGNTHPLLLHPDWFGAAMTKLSTSNKPNVQQLYPLPAKVQQSTIAHDFIIAANRLSALSVSK